MQTPRASPFVPLGTPRSTGKRRSFTGDGEEILAVPSSEMERLHSLITDIKTRMGEERSRLQGELHQEERRHDSTAVKLAAVYRQLRMQLFSLGVYPGGTGMDTIRAPDALATSFHAWRAHTAFQAAERTRSQALLGTFTRVHEWVTQRRTLRLWQERVVQRMHGRHVLRMFQRRLDRQHMRGALLHWAAVCKPDHHRGRRLRRLVHRRLLRLVGIAFRQWRLESRGRFLRSQWSLVLGKAHRRSVLLMAWRSWVAGVAVKQIDREEVMHELLDALAAAELPVSTVNELRSLTAHSRRRIAHRLNGGGGGCEEEDDCGDGPAEEWEEEGGDSQRHHSGGTRAQQLLRHHASAARGSPFRGQHSRVRIAAVESLLASSGGSSHGGSAVKSGGRAARAAAALSHSPALSASGGAARSGGSSAGRSRSRLSRQHSGGETQLDLSAETRRTGGDEGASGPENPQLGRSVLGAAAGERASPAGGRGGGEAAAGPAGPSPMLRRKVSWGPIPARSPPHLGPAASAAAAATAAAAVAAAAAAGARSAAEASFSASPVASTSASAQHSPEHNAAASAAASAAAAAAAAVHGLSFPGAAAILEALAGGPLSGSPSELPGAPPHGADVDAQTRRFPLPGAEAHLAAFLAAAAEAHGGHSAGVGGEALEGRAEAVQQASSYGNLYQQQQQQQQQRQQQNSHAQTSPLRHPDAENFDPQMGVPQQVGRPRTAPAGAPTRAALLQQQGQAHAGSQQETRLAAMKRIAAAASAASGSSGAPPVHAEQQPWGRKPLGPRNGQPGFRNNGGAKPKPAGSSKGASSGASFEQDRAVDPYAYTGHDIHRFLRSLGGGRLVPMKKPKGSGEGGCGLAGGSSSGFLSGYHMVTMGSSRAGSSVAGSHRGDGGFDGKAWRPAGPVGRPHE